MTIGNTMRAALNGLTPRIYLQYQLLGLFISAILLYIELHGGKANAAAHYVQQYPWLHAVFYLVNTLCFPIAGYVWQQMSQPVWAKFEPNLERTILNTAKCFMLLFCWGFAWLIAPAGCRKLARQATADDSTPTHY